MCKHKTGDWTRRQFVVALAAAGMVAGTGVPTLAQSALTGEASLRELMAGNERFTTGKISSFSEDLKILQEKTVLKQEPFAAVLSCADSRVPVEILFDQTIGHLFVTRVANDIARHLKSSQAWGGGGGGRRRLLRRASCSPGVLLVLVKKKEEWWKAKEE